MKISKISVALLLIQLAIVSTVAAKYLYQRWTCPRVWVRTVAVDPELMVRGRYLSLRLTVDGCGSTLPSAGSVSMPRNLNGVPVGKRFAINSAGRVQFLAKIKVEGNRLLAIRIPDSDSTYAAQTDGLWVVGWPNDSCEDLLLDPPVDFYISEHAQDPSRLKPGQELWIEVTVPPKGPPRPIQLALKDNSAWKPLAIQ